MTVAVPYVESGIAIAKVSRRVRLSSVFSSSHADDLLRSIDGAIEARMARLSTIGVDSMSPSIISATIAAATWSIPRLTGAYEPEASVVCEFSSATCCADECKLSGVAFTALNPI